MDQDKIDSVYANLSEEEILNLYQKVADNENTRKFILSQRQMRLQATDWSQGVDVPEEIQLKYQPYRQALRDITETEEYINDPINVIWPDEPV